MARDAGHVVSRRRYAPLPRHLLPCFPMSTVTSAIRTAQRVDRFTYAIRNIVTEARKVEAARLASYSQAVKAIEREDDAKIAAWRKALAAKS